MNTFYFQFQLPGDTLFSYLVVKGGYQNERDVAKAAARMMHNLNRDTVPITYFGTSLTGD